MPVAPTGSTANFTWRSDGVTAVITPFGGSAVSVSVNADQAANIMMAIKNDANAGVPITTTINRQITASKKSQSGFVHIEI